MVSKEQKHDDVEVNETASDVVAKGFEKDLRQSLADLLKIEKDEIDQEEQFSEYGVDSILLTQWANKLNDTFGLELTPTVFFENYTLVALQGYVLENYKQLLNKRYAFDKQNKSIERTISVNSREAPLRSVLLR